MKKLLPLVLLIASILSCRLPAAQGQATAVAEALSATAASWTATPTFTLTFTPTEAFTPTLTLTPTETLTPTLTLTPTVTATPTYAFPTVTVNKQAHCRYGPSVAYLHAADLYAGDTGTVRGRFIYSKWLYVKFDKLNYFCWVAPSVVDVVGDISQIAYKELNLQSIGSNMYGPPRNVQAVRDGNQVTITWERVEMTEDDDRGYLLELFVCQNGAYLWWTDSYPNQFTTSYTVKDEAGCPLPSSGKLYTVEKHGFSQPAVIPWPPP
ncbi:MAG: fibronectin type III domain-containing protein [Chloroflexota bacterium]